jgi:5-methylthioadenosine/S-adenosylhomocysteine deaminase
VLALSAPGQFDTLEHTTVLNAHDRLVMPAWSNGHTHAHGGLGRGAVEDVRLEGFLAASPSINGQRGWQDMALSATLTAVELLKKGCTALFDMSSEFPLPTVAGLHAVARAYEAVGIRAVVAPMMADSTLYQAYPALLDSLPAALQTAASKARGADAATCLATVRAAAQDWPFDTGRIRLGIAPTIPLFCSDAFMQGCAELSAEFNLPMQIHLAESRLQAVQGQARYGRSLVAHMASLGLLSPRLSVAHAIWIDDDDIERLAQAGVTAVHNPLSNLRLGSGVAAIRRMKARGLRVALGTDGANTSDTQNLFEAARLAAYLSRIMEVEEDQWITAGEAWEMGTTHSAHALGWGERLGKLAPGFEADLVLLDLSKPIYVPLRHAMRQLVHGENGAAVSHVLVAGQVVVENDRLLTLDEAALRQQAEEAARRLDAINEEGRHLAQAMRPWIGAFCGGVARSGCC